MIYNIYFSPTGGTRAVADTLAKSVACNTGAENVSVDLIKKGEFGQSFSPEDVCLLSAPAYGGRVPANAVNKIKTFVGNGAKAVVVAVFGNRAIDDTLIELYDLAQSVGFNVVAGVEAVAEHSLARVYGANRPCQQDKNELDNFGKNIAEKIKNNLSNCLEIPGNRPYKDAKASPMSPVVEANCLNCKKCAVECPVNAISTDDVTVIDTEKCFSCMHCVAVCPVKARHNSAELTAAFEERLRERCDGVKPNKLYI